jgi:outer membrane receptor protein involved in Fe transport
MRNWLCIALVVSVPAWSFAQKNGKGNEPGKLSGKVMDSLTSQPIDYASVSLYVDSKGQPVTGVVTDSSGRFSFDHLTPGEYRLVIEFVGYRTKTISNLNFPNTGLHMGTIRLSQTAGTLSGVTVTAQKGLIENKIDKIVYNVEKDVTSQGGVATDALKKIPMVSVDVDGNVELQGNSNILFLVNGKPSTIFGNNLAEALQNIPASQIKSIEVITSPGSKYDAEGTGGIINIILKESKIQGINGNVNLSAGTRLENGSFNLNGRKGNFGANVYFSGNAQLRSTTLNSTDRPSFDSTGKMTSDLGQNGQSEFTRNGYQTGLGLDWAINKMNNLSGGFGYNNFGNQSNGYLNQQQLLYDSAGNIASDVYTVVHSLNHFRGQSFDWNMNYRRKFARDGQQLEVRLQSSNGKNKTYFDQYQTNMMGDTTVAGNYSNNEGADHETSIQADYSHPFSDNLKLETGGKMDARKITSNTQAFALNPSNESYYTDTIQTNSMVYDRYVYAGYASLAFPIGKFLDVKSGVRYEWTRTEANYFKSPQAAIPSYGIWAPSIFLSHKLSESQSISASYSKRIQRPGYRWLNPFVNVSDPKNISQGNPLLKPEISNNFQLAYNINFEKGGSFNTVAFYNQSRQDIQPYVVYYPTYQVGDSLYENVSVTTPENVGTENNYGLNFYGSIPFTNKLNVRTNLAFYYRYIENAIVVGQNITSFNYRVNMNISYQLNENLVMEAFGNFNSPRNEVQGKFPSFTSYNFALRKLVWKKKGSFGFTTTNPFNEYVNQTTAVKGEGFVLNSTRKIPFRSFGISFMYKFGKLEFKKEKEREDRGSGNQDEGN